MKSTLLGHLKAPKLVWANAKDAAELGVDLEERNDGDTGAWLAATIDELWDF
jgi:hypothetical protein